MSSQPSPVLHAPTIAAARPREPVRLVMALLVATLLLAGQTPPTAAHADRHAGPTSSQLSGACPAGTPSAGFPDVAGNTHEATVDCVSWYGIARGVLPGAYAPARSVRRDQLASFVARLLDTAGVALPAPTDQGFGDIDGNTHADPINQLAELGIVQGTSAAAFSPTQPVRRDQMASFLVRAYEHVHGQPLAAPPSAFTDIQGNVHAAAIDAAAAAGFTQGTSATTYSPAQAVRRDQMASFLARVLDRGADDGHVAARQPPPAVLTDALPLHVRGVGQARAGMTLAEVEQATATPVDVQEFGTFGGHCYYGQAQGVDAYSFMVVAPGEQPPADPMQGVVVRASSTLFDGEHTPTTAGVRPGDPRGAVTAAYGDQVTA
ncbi:MAG: S-layer homology domain-containing protein, partial [Egibacteraceae bacterium]